MLTRVAIGKFAVLKIMNIFKETMLLSDFILVHFPPLKPCLHFKSWYFTTKIPAVLGLVTLGIATQTEMILIVKVSKTGVKQNSNWGICGLKNQEHFQRNCVIE